MPRAITGPVCRRPLLFVVECEQVELDLASPHVLSDARDFVIKVAAIDKLIGKLPYVSKVPDRFVVEVALHQVQHRLAAMLGAIVCVLGVDVAR
jgi:hypothetical protein